MLPVQNEALCHDFAQALPDAMARAVPGTLLRVEVPVAATAPLAWLDAQAGWTQYYWGSRDDAFEMAGIGEALITEPAGDPGPDAVFARLRRVLPPDDPRARHYGGFRFHGGPVKDSRWRNFKEYRFVVPRIELCRRSSDYSLAYTHLCGENDTPEAILGLLEADLADIQLDCDEESPPLPAFRDRIDNPDEAGWAALVEKTLRALEAHDLEKIVLARESSFTADAPINSVALLQRLRARQPGTFTFCFHPVADRAFLGASPERLYWREGRAIESEALAGTRPRSANSEEDTRLGAELRASEKDLREHSIVVNTIAGNLKSLCEHVETPGTPQLMRLENVQHLHTPLRGRLQPEVSDGALIEMLHPTPAVGGAPRGPALDWIARHEPFDRGIYAAPAGWVGADAAEFCVAIRSGLVQKNTLTLYNGAGIVPASAPAEEWAEIEAKMAGFLEAMTEEAAE